MSEDAVAWLIILGFFAVIVGGIAGLWLHERREEKRAAKMRCEMLQRALDEFKRMGFVSPGEEDEAAKKDRFDEMLDEAIDEIDRLPGMKDAIAKRDFKESWGKD